MKNRLPILNSIALGALLIAGITLGLTNERSPKVAIFEMEELMYSYDGTAEASERYAAQMTSYSNEADSLQSILRKMVISVRQDSLNGDYDRIAQKRDAFIQIRDKWNQLNQEMQSFSVEGDQAMTKAVVGQLQLHVRRFAMDNKYDLVLSNTQLENIAYAGETLDITEELTAWVNTNYQDE